MSLVPSITETLRAWGVDPVACTRFCEQRDLPTVGGTKDPDVDAIVELRPDLVVMDEEENRAEDAAAIHAAGIDVVATAVRSVADVGPALALLADAIGLDAPPVDVPPFAPVAERAGPGVRAFVPIWRRPYMTLNRFTYGSSLLERLGVRNVFADAPERYPEVILAEAAARDPDVVLAPTEPYPFGPKHEDELSTVAPVVFVDGADLFWWGVRTPVAIARLAETLSRR
ncbi:MAG TPA: helical backbone metal receptor [Acidimicrobiales bacterium]